MSRIIAGRAKGHRLAMPKGVRTRPTTDRTREALFSTLASWFDAADADASSQLAGVTVLDLFAGSGAIGLEALSRGAASCVFVDESRQSHAVIGENLAKARLDGGRPVKAEALAFLKRDAATYDLIFADPPYWKHHGDKDHVGALLASGLLAPRLAPGGLFIAEVSANQASPEGGGLALADRREYGGSAVLFYESET